LTPAAYFSPYINKPLPTSKAIPTSLSSPVATKLSSSQVPMANREIVPYGVEDALPLSIILPREIAPIPLACNTPGV